MAISFDKALGIHEDAIGLRSKRAEVIANNIANADTPNFQARDIDFKSVLQGVQGAQQNQAPLKMVNTNATHQDAVIHPDYAAELLFRTPTQPSVDGNTVDVQEEMARYTENALGYQASFDFINRKFKGLSSAIKGN
ncbi:flagellar basal body rod protein FlgB [Neptunomonas japonica]|uniref:Flagellar basal body rod protein FlgB n=1 Tax=Neptunomonas japonica JAMM 1380 TaxID=1441457 RepID=A0A7R6PEI6_9GAMM|nr:flagellar basal body rod protein FlgB [Neptunomonas japonica]BBB28642.1 flagellar basal-body rod protein FlgB [Neptunomonas japonica JAMM 1380]